MKYLSDYVRDDQTKLFDSLAVIFAFNQLQLDKSKKEGVEYISLGGGLVLPKQNKDIFIQQMEFISKNGIKQDIAENGIQNIILRELANYECAYSYDTSIVEAALSGYGITKEQIIEVFPIYIKDFEKHNK